MNKLQQIDALQVAKLEACKELALLSSFICINRYGN